MKYFNPLRLFPDFIQTQEFIGVQEIKLAKKRLLAEFELLDTTTISIEGHTFDKDQVIKLFDSLEKSKNLLFHTFIFKEKLLLNFLEYGDSLLFNDINILNKRFIEFSKQEGFITFLRPYFTKQADKLLLNAVKSNDHEFITTFCKVNFPETYENDLYKLTYRHIYGYIQEAKEIENNLKKEHFVSNTVFTPLIDPAFIKTLNALPNYFSILRNQYAIGLYNLVFILHNELKRSSIAQEIVNKGLAIKSEPETQSLYQNAASILNEHTENSKPRSFVMYLIYAVQFLFILVLLINGCPPTSSKKYEPINITIPKYEPDVAPLTTPQYQTKPLIDTNLLNQLKIESMLIDSLLQAYKRAEKNRLLDSNNLSQDTIQHFRPIINKKDSQKITNNDTL